MLTTKQLLGMTPKNALAAMLNDINPGLAVSGQDLIVGTPQAVGPTLTQLTLTMRRTYADLDFVPYQGSVTFTYNRLDIANFAALAFAGFVPNLPTTTQTLLDRLAALFGCQFDTEDFVIEEISADNGGTYLLKTQPTSLRWVGQYAVDLGDISELIIVGDPPPMIVNVPYRFQFQGQGGKPPYVWIGNGLPSGVTLDSRTGTLQGRRSLTANIPITVMLKDSQNQIFSQEFTLKVVPATLVNPKLEIVGTYPSATVGIPYSIDLPIVGGDGNYINPRVDTLPPGLSLSIVDDKLRLAGTPTAPFFGLGTFAVDAGDGQVATLLQQFVTLQPMALNGSYMNAIVGLPFVDALAITGGSGDYFDPILVDGSVLPPGIDTLIINHERIEIRGTPTELGTHPFRVLILTGYGQSLTVDLALTVVSPASS